MRIEEQNERKILWLLKEIQKKILMLSPDAIVEFDLSQQNEIDMFGERMIIKSNEKQKILNELADAKIITIPLFKTKKLPGHLLFIIHEKELNQLVIKLKQKIESSLAEQPYLNTKFRYDLRNAVLHRDGVDPVLPFAEDSDEHELLSFIFARPFGERVDGATEGIGISGRKIYDTARRINKKIQSIFGIERLLEEDYPSKATARLVE